MTTGDVLGLAGSQEQLVTRILQSVLVGLIAIGLITVWIDVVVTAVLALGITLLPALLRKEYGYSMDPGLVLWITVAMLLHTVGSLGLYEQYQWYDEITHAASATLIAGAGYASFRALELYSNEIDVPTEFRAVFIVVFVLAMGLLWEVLEFTFDGLVTVYGIDDIVTDFVFNAVGAILVAIWGTGYVDGLIGFFRDRLQSS